MENRDYWSRWFNVDNPSYGYNNGDYETLYNIEKESGRVCDKGYDIAEAQCRINNRSPPDFTFNKDTRWDDRRDVLYRFCTNEGLICRNNDQPFFRNCHDYSIRFRCHYISDNNNSNNSDGYFPQFDVRIYIVLAVVPILIFLIRMLWAYVFKRRRQQRRNERRARRQNRAGGEDIDDDSSSVASGLANPPPSYQDLFGKTGHLNTGSSVFAISKDNIPICSRCETDSCSIASIIGKQRSLGIGEMNRQTERDNLSTEQEIQQSQDELATASENNAGIFSATDEDSLPTVVDNLNTDGSSSVGSPSGLLDSAMIIISSDVATTSVASDSSSVTTSPPVTTPPFVTTSPPVASLSPATTPSSVTTSSPATTPSSVTTSSPVTTPSSVTTSSPVTTPSPVTATSPVTTSSLDSNFLGLAGSSSANCSSCSYDSSPGTSSTNLSDLSPLANLPDQANTLPVQDSSPVTGSTSLDVLPLSSQAQVAELTSASESFTEIDLNNITSEGNAAAGNSNYDINYQHIENGNEESSRHGSRVFGTSAPSPARNVETFDPSLSLNASFLSSLSISQPCACPCHRTIPLKHKEGAGYDNQGYNGEMDDIEAGRYHTFPGMHVPALGLHRVWSNVSVSSSVTQAELPSYEVAVELIKTKQEEESKQSS